MSLTACPRNGAQAMARSLERLELFAALWQLGESETPYCANPRLLHVLQLIPLLRSHRAAVLLTELRRGESRDRLIKHLLTAGHGLEVPPGVAELVQALDALSSEWDQALGVLAPLLREAHAAMMAEVAPLSQGLRPAEDLQRLTGQADQLQVRVLPSLFLPPPQTGRHGALVDSPDEGAVAYLCFGYPLDQDPTTFGITPYWVLGGAWHYAVDRFIRRHWPPIADSLRQMPALEQAITQALAPHRESVRWPLVLAEHINIALKCHLSRQACQPELVHRGFARARGLVLFPWFDRWIGGLAADPGRFVAGFQRLPAAVERDLDQLLDLAASAASGPPSINLALANGQERAVLVIPDRWEQSLLDAIAERWAVVTPAVMREASWQSSPQQHSQPLIAFGEAGRDTLVDGLLEKRGLSLERSDDGGDVLVALVPSASANRPWSLAIAVDDPAVAADFAAESALDLFHSVARFAGHRFVEGDGLQSVL